MKSPLASLSVCPLSPVVMPGALEYLAGMRKALGLRTRTPFVVLLGLPLGCLLACKDDQGETERPSDGGAGMGGDSTDNSGGDSSSGGKGDGAGGRHATGGAGGSLGTGGKEQATGGKGGSDSTTGGASVGTGGRNESSGGDAATGGATHTSLQEVTISIFGRGADIEVALLDGSNRSATTDESGRVVFEDVPVPYGAAAIVFKDVDHPGILEVQGITRDDPILVMPTGFVNISNVSFSGTATPSVPDGVSVPAASGQTFVVVGTAITNNIVPTDGLGVWTNRGIVWPGSEPLESRMFGLYLWTGDARPIYISSGESSPISFEAGATPAEVLFSVDDPVAARDHDVSVDFGTLATDSVATVTLWSAQLRDTRFALGSAYGQNDLHTIDGHDGGPQVVASAIPEAGAALSVQFDDDPANTGTGSFAQLTRPVADASSSFAIDVDRIPRPSSEALPDLSGPPVLSWTELPGASALMVTLRQDGLFHSLYTGVLPGDATSLELSQLYAMSGELEDSETFTVSVSALYLDGYSPDVYVNGLGQPWSARPGMLGDEDDFDLYRRDFVWE